MSSRPVKVQNNNNKIIVIIIITTLASTEHLLGIKFFFFFKQHVKQLILNHMLVPSLFYRCEHEDAELKHLFKV